MKILDANMIIRLFIKDNEDMANRVVEIIDNNPVMILSEVAAEVIYVMTKHYGKERDTVASALTSLLELDNVSAKDEGILQYGIELYKRTSLDFVDCLLCSYQIKGGGTNGGSCYEVCTFDKKLNKLIAREMSE